MDFLGEIVEKDVVQPPEPLSFPTHQQQGPSGFPKFDKNNKNKKPSQWRSRLQQKGISSMSGAASGLAPGPGSDSKSGHPGSEAERIHQENIDLLNNMSLEEKERERQELIDSLDPEIIEMLLKKSGFGSKKDQGEWYGSKKGEGEWGEPMDDETVNKALGITEEAPIKPKPKTKAEAQKKVTFVSEDEEEDNYMPTKEQIDEIESQSNMINNVHFPKPPSQDTDKDDDDTPLLDINDPDFNDKLHEKYFPDLPKDTENLKWMQPVENEIVGEIVEDVKDLRFDFQGNILSTTTTQQLEDVPTHLGLHHHSEHPSLPGYTLSELAHYARSSFNSQRCIAIQTIGRILHKLGTNSYNFEEVDDEGNELAEEEDRTIKKKLWELIENLQILQTLKEFSDEKYERNLSVRNYCIEALWLWKQGEQK